MDAPTDGGGPDAGPALPSEPTTAAPGDLLERACTRVYELTGLVEGEAGDPWANGDRLREVLASAEPGDCITAAPGRYLIAGNVHFDRPGVTLKGLGEVREATIFEHTTDLEALFQVTADDVEFLNFTHYVPGGLSTRSSQGERGEGNTWVADCTGFRAQDYLAWGSHDAAIFFYGAHHFTLNRVESRDSQSDAYHVSNGSSYGRSLVPGEGAWLRPHSGRDWSRLVLRREPGDEAEPVPRPRFVGDDARLVGFDAGHARAGAPVPTAVTSSRNGQLFRRSSDPASWPTGS